ncbi:MAG: septal ring lytic transglycosylase RlpA family protein [Nitrosomonas sp.]|nr:septal ring lytic transglycosylase RlpA family protein [Nitrosomonas sp.]
MHLKKDFFNNNLNWLSFFLVIILLHGCSSPSPYVRSGEKISLVPPNSPTVTQGKNYYLDDGPEENPPTNLDAIPSANPQPETIRPANMRSYMVFGQTYTPMKRIEPYKQQGIASWYGRRFHGKPTASGEVYDMYGMTAAHPTLPIPSYARITNLNNGRSIVVRINDRGPFIANRLIDLSYTAAYQLNILANGSGPVEVESIIPQNDQFVSNRLNQPIKTTPINQVNQIFLQLGAFGSKHNADKYLSQIRQELASIGENINITQEGNLYKVHIGPYTNHASAKEIAHEILQRIAIKPLLTMR